MRVCVGVCVSLSFVFKVEVLPADDWPEAPPPAVDTRVPTTCAFLSSCSFSLGTRKGVFGNMQGRSH